MFVRKIKNPNGKTYIQVIDKSAGKYKVLKNIGSSSNEEEIKTLIIQGKNWINKELGVQEIDFTNYQQQMEDLFSLITEHKLIGLELVLGKIFNEIGFNEIKDELFRQLVIFRIAFPKSKLKTTEYLSRYLNSSWSEDQIYYFFDKLYNKQKEKVQNISYRHTKKILKNDIKVVFYDVTTLYFEISNEDNLRKTGFSKEGRHQNPQIILGLLVSENAYPLAYEIHPGNQFEGNTMLPIIEKFRSKYNLNNLIVVADSGLMSKNNIDLLIENNYEFIIGARIKNESKCIKEQILNLNLTDNQADIIKKGDLNLIISYSDK